MTVICTLALAADIGVPAPAHAQTSANVTVDAASSIGAIPSTASGVNTAAWDGLLTDPSVPAQLESIGVNALRYPGGSTSDVYHWQTNSGTAGTNSYTNPNDDFDVFMGIAKAAGASPIITVDYGSNAAGTAGGDPNEAAAWVAYSNVTKQYGVKYWEIGNELYGNGEYGAQWEEDLHSSHSPTTYGTNVALYSAAMKAKDPTIKVGAVLALPGNWPDGETPDWNSNVLAKCGGNIDFVILHWYPQEPGSESDSYLLSSTNQIAAMIAKTKALIKQYCGVNAPNVQIFITETNSVSSDPGKQSVSLVNALFLADDFATWLENGVGNVDWWCLHNGATDGNLSSSLYGAATFGDYGLFASTGSPEPANETPFPAYYGFQMLSVLGRPGDSMAPVTSDQALLAAHAVKQVNGDLALMLINKDSKNTTTVNVSVTGYTPSKSTEAYFYGKGSTAITGNVIGGGSNFNIALPPYSVTTLVMTPGGGSSGPAFRASTTLSTSVVNVGKTSTTLTTLTNFGASAVAVNIYQNVVNASGALVGQKLYPDRSFGANNTHTYTYTWTAPATPGVFHAGISVTSLDGSAIYYSNNGLATITVNPIDHSKYSFETSAQGWATSGGMISGVGYSRLQAFEGDHSLVVSFNGTAADAQQAYIASPGVGPGKTVTFHVWIPSGSGITAIQPFVQQGSAGGWAWTGNYIGISLLQTGAWNTLAVTVPANAKTPLYQLGVQFFTAGAWAGQCFVDSVNW